MSPEEQDQVVYLLRKAGVDPSTIDLDTPEGATQAMETLGKLGLRWSGRQPTPDMARDAGLGPGYRTRALDVSGMGGLGAYFAGRTTPMDVEIDPDYLANLQDRRDALEKGLNAQIDNLAKRAIEAKKTGVDYAKIAADLHGKIAGAKAQTAMANAQALDAMASQNKDALNMLYGGNGPPETVIQLTRDPNYTAGLADFTKSPARMDVVLTDAMRQNTPEAWNKAVISVRQAADGQVQQLLNAASAASAVNPTNPAGIASALARNEQIKADLATSASRAMQDAKAKMDSLGVPTDVQDRLLNSIALAAKKGSDQVTASVSPEQVAMAAARGDIPASFMQTFEKQRRQVGADFSDASSFAEELVKRALAQDDVIGLQAAIEMGVKSGQLPLAGDAYKEVQAINKEIDDLYANRPMVGRRAVQSVLSTDPNAQRLAAEKGWSDDTLLRKVERNPSIVGAQSPIGLNDPLIEATAKRVKANAPRDPLTPNPASAVNGRRTPVGAAAPKPSTPGAGTPQAGDAGASTAPRFGDAGASEEPAEEGTEAPEGTVGAVRPRANAAEAVAASTPTLGRTHVRRRVSAFSATG